MNLRFRTLVLLSAVLVLAMTASARAQTAAAKPKPVAPAPQPKPITGMAVWLTASLEDLVQMADFVSQVPEAHGLYLTPMEQNLVAQIRMMNPEQSRAALVPLFTAIARQLYTGRLNGAEVGSDIRFSKKSLPDEKIREMMNESAGSTERLIKLLSPQIVDYRMLLRLLNRLKEIQTVEVWGALPKFKKPLKLGVVDPAVVELKKRLVSLGFQITNLDSRFDEQTDAAVADIQRQLKLKPDRIVSPGGGTQKYLETPIAERIEQVRADLEKLRWLPQNPTDRYIFVNLAFSSLLLMDRSRANPVVFNFKTINGRVERKTPSMVDKIYQIILNPYWTVPPTVFIKDKVEMIRHLGYWEVEDYFAQNNFIVVSENFRQQYSPSQIDWRNITSSSGNGFFIRQKPNYFNALGVVKFGLTNGEAIYLHDTGERELFSEENRLRSSGCVRLEQPLEMAEYLLAGTKWDRFAIENHVARPGEVLDRETPIEVKNQIPVYMLPITSHYASDKVMRFTADVYGHNQSIRAQTSYSLF
ncbi:MAG: L,D-transpeptidase family protein [Bdellovibrio sp.]|jgi:murein L,D-transpeptidase YcbB/YkuD